MDGGADGTRGACTVTILTWLVNKASRVIIGTAVAEGAIPMSSEGHSIVPCLSVIKEES